MCRVSSKLLRIFVEFGGKERGEGEKKRESESKKRRKRHRNSSRARACCANKYNQQNKNYVCIMEKG